MSRPNTSAVAAIRARRRAAGLRSTEAVLHEAEIAVLDDIKERFGLGSRSEAIRLLIARTDPSTITPAEASTLSKSAA